MSAGYASRLKDYPNKGVCGLPELSETARAYANKVKELVLLIKESKHTVVLTGAGISTAAGIPDFRGPNGIWTLEEKKQKTNKKQNRKRKKEEPIVSEDNATQREEESDCPSMDFAAAKPTFTHRAITRLVSKGIVQFCITQNVDGLHRRSGLPRDKHAVLHGCAFTEACTACGTEHFRDFDVGGMSFQKTGRQCEACSGDLVDTLLDWEDALPEDDLERSRYECTKADLVLCLGTSLRICPVRDLPLDAKQFVIVNLQKTPLDDDAAIVIRERTDKVMKDLMEYLEITDMEDDDETPQIERLWKPSCKVNESVTR